MSKTVSYLAFASLVAGALLSGTAIASSDIYGAYPTTSSTVAQAPDTSGDAALPISTKEVCDRFYNTIESKKRNEALKQTDASSPKDATVVAIDQIETILKKRDEALKGKTTSNAKSTLDEAEKNIDGVVPSADRSWYELIRKKRYDYDQKYAPVCPTASY